MTPAPDDLLLDYHLGQLDATARRAVEDRLGADPALAARSDRLGTRLGLLLDAPEPPPPPADLAARTLARVRSAVAATSPPDALPGPVQVAPFRLTDLAVAAAVLIAGLASLAPALLSLRDTAVRTACVSNLQQLVAAFNVFGNTHNAYPAVPTGHRVARIGFDMLNAGMISDPRHTACPSRNVAATSYARITPDALAAAGDADPTGCDDYYEGAYPLNPGYRQPDGSFRRIPANRGETVPLAGDHPPMDEHCRVLAGNSPNHRHAGQHVGFSSGEVRFVSDRRWDGRDDIYANAPGHDLFGSYPPDDFRLVPSCYRVERVR
jgi:hypothetical protein